ncbi:MAG: hypothetical protein RBU37_05230 [Myxococcota bacterium]|nr:hypothetical protein [Myxococcota bacterium]
MGKRPSAQPTKTWEKAKRPIHKNVGEQAKRPIYKNLGEGQAPNLQKNDEEPYEQLCR